MRELQTERRRCGECEYELTPLPASKALQVLRRLGKAVGPALAQLGALDAQGTSLGALGEAIEQLFAGLSDEDVAFINRAFAEQSTVVLADGSQPSLGRTFDVHFQGRLGEWFEWIRFSLEVNFGPLVGALGATVGARRAVAAE